jgi:CspA family cold shock protein
MSEQVRVSGIVKWYDDTKGFGFIQCEGHNRDIFVHKQQLDKSNVSSIQEGDRVTLVINEGVKGSFATNLAKEIPR